ncbi:MAG: hypothetical protein QXH80_02695 [Candidatus Nanoarchaeia archaeon]
MKNHIKEILLTLSDSGIKYILAGGVAAVIHGVERLTLDIDISIDMQYNKLFKDSISIEIEGRKIQVVSVKQLLEMKRNIIPLRPKDKMDIEILESLQ